MKKIRVLIADDSVVYRSLIRAALTELPNVEVTGAASNGRLAIERLSQTAADLVILDLEMPEMDGLQTLTEIKKQGFPCKVLMFSSASKRGAEITMEALKLGASDFIAKPGGAEAGETNGPQAKIRLLLEPKINALFYDTLPDVSVQPGSPKHEFKPVDWAGFQPEIVVIGSSTGGPSALERVFSNLRGPLNCPIIIVQHMPPIFTAVLAERLYKISGVPATEASDGMLLQKNNIYVAPGDFHLRLHGEPGNVHIKLDQGPMINYVRPAVDPLFESAATIYKMRCLAIVLTGMGADGRWGSESVKNSGGAVVIQNQESCVVFGMPGAVFQSGAFDRAIDPESIASLLNEKIGGTLRA